ncbi:hypothetical protein [Halomonas koreensis]|uniref:DUF3426 domain-containing protein n=1 Tax=Halomonas koreensis TaxID=245385 RepID=A0ABU1G0F0_9GAMM|nr:hypothetical protein [Halomonas koreensis]MDR5866402.1 hypothetical protein [Halomonas koreensis]
MPPSGPHGRPSSRSPLLRLLILVTLLTLAVALWYLLRHGLDGRPDVAWTPPEAACDLQAGPCRAALGEGRALSLSIPVEGPIRALTPLPLRVRLDGVPAEAATVTFVGRDMDMGLHRFPLTAGGDGTFRGQGQVALCTEARMPWRAEVVVDTPDGRLGSWFDFEVRRHTP